MNQTLLKIEIPKGKELRGADFREILAKETTLPEAFFHYENGKPKSSKGVNNLQTDALPPICILSGRGWVGILAQPGYEELLELATGKAIRIVNQRLGSICKVELQNPEFGCFAKNTPSTYWVREMVMKRRNLNARVSNVEDLVERRVKAGLERYADAYGHVLPSWLDLDLRITKCERPRGLAIRTTSGTTNEYATLVDVEFKAFVDLKGIWMLGNLTSRGYGRVGYFKEFSASKLEVIK
jgi:hypothetical protein